MSTAATAPAAAAATSTTTITTFHAYSITIYTLVYRVLYFIECVTRVCVRARLFKICTRRYIYLPTPIPGLKLARAF